METTKDFQAATVGRNSPFQASIWVSAEEAEIPRQPEAAPLRNHPPVGKVHACHACQRSLQQSQDHLRRADRDLAETATFVAAILTTVTAVEAVINIAVDKLNLREFPLQLAFEAYIAICLLIFVVGFVRGRSAIRKRAQAEREIDLAKKGIFEFCPSEQWPRVEE